MKNLFKFLTVLLLALNSLLVIAETENCECVQAFNGDRFLAPSPEGWRHDNKMMANRGILMLFYPSDNPYDGKLKASSVYMYVLPTAKLMNSGEKSENAPTVNTLIESRMAQIRKSEYRGSVLIYNGLVQPARNSSHKVTFADFEMPDAPLFEKVAYIEDDRTIWALILVAGSKKLLEENVQSFWHIIMNYSVQTKE